MRDFLEILAIMVGAGIALVIVLYVGLTLIFGNNHYYKDRFDSFRQHCTEAGGHLYGVDNEFWCLTVDGRILEVYP